MTNYKQDESLDHDMTYQIVKNIPWAVLLVQSKNSTPKSLYKYCFDPRINFNGLFPKWSLQVL